MFSEAKALFFQSLHAEGISSRTERNYREAIDQFVAFFLAEDLRGRLGAVQAEDIEGFLGHLRRLGRADNTVHNRWRTLRHFFHWCERRGLIAEDPSRAVRAPVERVEEIQPYSPEEIDRFMLATRQWPATALRDQAAIALLYNSGIRAGELCSLRRDNVREDAILVKGKGSRERWVGLETTTRRLLRMQMESRNGATLVFGLTASGLYRLVRRLAEEADVPGAYVHRFRDTFAVSFLENGGGLEPLQTILGHAKIESTLRYVMYDRGRRALEAQRRFAPFAVRRAS